MAEDSNDIEDLLRELTGESNGRAAPSGGTGGSGAGGGPGAGDAVVGGGALGAAGAGHPPRSPMSEPRLQASPGAGELRPPPAVDELRSQPDGRQLLMMGAAAVLLLMVMAGLIGWLVGRNGDATEAAEGADDGASAATGDLESEARSTTGDTTAADDAATETTAAPSSSTTSGEPFVAPSTPDNPFGAAQYVVVSGGKSYFRGWYPTQEVVDDMLATAAQIMGPENTIDETQIDPRAVLDQDNFRVYYDDPVLFELNSDQIADTFAPLVDAVGTAMVQDPTLTVTVIARTDATGAASYNMELSERRAEAVAARWLAMGIDPSRIELDPRGEEDADAEANEQMAALDRRVELIVKGSPIG